MSALRSAAIAIVLFPTLLQADTRAFIRGDVNTDGAVDIADPIASLWFAFLGGAAPSCLRAADADGDGQAAQVADAIYTLSYLFIAGPAPPQPFPQCGTATDAGPSCASAEICVGNEEPLCLAKIASATPPRLSLGVALTATIIIVFTEAIDPATVRATAGDVAGTVRLIDFKNGRDVAAGALEVDGAVLRFVPGELLAPDTAYALLVSRQVLPLCEDSLESAVATVFTTEASGSTQQLVRHPHPGHSSLPFDDIAWDVDWTQSVDLDWLRSSVEGGESFAAARNVVPDASAAFPDAATNHAPESIRYTKFHFWPNLIDLSEVYHRDLPLYERMISELLVNEPGGAGLAASLVVEIARGDRVFLARDFIDVVHHELAVFFEVHYGLLINLDARTAREPLVHRHAADGLPRLHDTHVDSLLARLATTAQAPLGEVWDLCLRGNFLPHRNGVNIDKLDEHPRPELFIGRVDSSCTSGSPGPPPPDDGEEDDPPLDKPPPGGGGEGGGGSPRSARVPVAPRPPDAPLGEDNAARNPGGACPTPAEEAALRGRQQQLTECKDLLREQRAEDIAAVNKTAHGWGASTFHDPCLAALFAEYDALIRAIEAQLAALTAQCAQAAAAETAAKVGASAPVRAAKERGDWWDDMIFRGGAWQDTEVPCPELVIFAKIELPPQLALDPNLRKNFHMAVHRGISRDGLSFDDAVKAALADPAIYPPGFELDPAIQLFWYTYSKCVKRLHIEMMKKWLDRYFPTATPEERERAIAVMLDGASAVTVAEQAACGNLKSQLEALQAARAVLVGEKAALRGEHERLRAEFRQRALSECFPASLEELKKKILELAVLRGFFGFCEELRRNPGNPNPAAGTVHHGFPSQEFCRLLRELIDRLRQMQAQGQPVSQAFLRYLEGFFQPGGNCAQPG